MVAAEYRGIVILEDNLDEHPVGLVRFQIPKRLVREHIVHRYHRLGVGTFFLVGDIIVHDLVREGVKGESPCEARPVREQVLVWNVEQDLEGIQGGVGGFRAWSNGCTREMTKKEDRKLQLFIQ